MVSCFSYCDLRLTEAINKVRHKAWVKLYLHSINLSWVLHCPIQVRVSTLYLFVLGTEPSFLILLIMGRTRNEQLTQNS